MIFWTIEFGTDRSPGWQIMDASLSNAKLYDANGNLLEGGFDYSVTGASDTPPVWWTGNVE